MSYTLEKLTNKAYAMLTIPNPQVVILSNVNMNKMADALIRIKGKLKSVGLNCRLDSIKEPGSINVVYDNIKIMDHNQYDLIIVVLDSRICLTQDDIGLVSHLYAAQAMDEQNKFFILLNNDSLTLNNQEFLSDDILNIIINNAFKNAFKRG